MKRQEGREEARQRGEGERRDGPKTCGTREGARVGCPSTAERADEETPVEASKRGLRRVARRERVSIGAGIGGKGDSGARGRGGFVGRGGTSGAGSGGKSGSGIGRGIGIVCGMIGCGLGSCTNTHLATSETAER